MIALAAAIGGACGAMLIFTMHRIGMLAERSGTAVLLAAIASFYPVFAVMSGDLASIAVHATIFAGFLALAAYGFRVGMYILAGGIIAHGVFDIGLMFLPAPGPEWWPAFCAGVDIAAGTALVRLMQKRKVPQ